MAIITRAQKGSALTYEELDNNFLELASGGNIDFVIDISDNEIITDINDTITSITDTVDSISTAISEIETTLNFSIDDVSANLTTNYYTKTQTDGGISTAISALQTTLSSEIDGLSTTVSETAASVNGISGTYALTINNNGQVSGFALTSDIVDGNTGAYSTFVIAADRFSVVDPANNASNPFTVRTTPVTTADGTVLPAGVYIDNIYVENASSVFGGLGTFRTATTGERVVIQDDRIEVYDANNILRVRIGNLA